MSDEPELAEEEQENAGYASIPIWWIIVAVVVVILFGLLSYWLGQTPTFGLINVILATMVVASMLLLFATPSEAGKMGKTEIILAVMLLLSGILVGSSPTMAPLWGKCWKVIGFGASDVTPIAIPTPDMWEVKENQISPTEKVPGDQMLCVRLPYASHGIVLTPEGLKFEPGVEMNKVEVYLQDRNDGRTSSSRLIK